MNKFAVSSEIKDDLLFNCPLTLERAQEYLQAQFALKPEQRELSQFLNEYNVLRFFLLKRLSNVYVATDFEGFASFQQQIEQCQKVLYRNCLLRYNSLQEKALALNFQNQIFFVNNVLELLEDKDKFDLKQKLQEEFLIKFALELCLSKEANPDTNRLALDIIESFFVKEIVKEEEADIMEMLRDVDETEVKLRLNKFVQIMMKKVYQQQQ